MRGNEWYAEILGKKHKLYTPLKELSERKTGLYFNKGWTDGQLKLQHIASDTEILISDRSIDDTSGFKEIDSIIRLSVVWWMNEWWFTGISSTNPFNADVILDEKNSHISRGLFNQDENAIKKVIDSQKKSFLDINKNSLIAFFDTGEDTQIFLNKFMEHHHKSLNIKPEDIEKSKKRARKMGYMEEANLTIEIDDEFSEANGLVFFNPNAGIEMLFDHNHLFDSKYAKGINEEMSVFDVHELIINGNGSKELLSYLLDLAPISIVKFNNEKPGDNLLRNNYDFMLRFMNPTDYNMKPGVTLI